MVSQPSTAPSSTGLHTSSGAPNREGMADWLAKAIDQGGQPEQALAFLGLGLMRSLQLADPAMAPFWPELPEGTETGTDLAALRQRLDLTDLAIRTGAPLSTAEVAQLLGARPGSGVVQRAGLVARRLGRNVWRLSRSDDDTSATQPSRLAQDGFRRRL